MTKNRLFIWIQLIIITKWLGKQNNQTPWSSIRRFFSLSCKCSLIRSMLAFWQAICSSALRQNSTMYRHLVVNCSPSCDGTLAISGSSVGGEAASMELVVAVSEMSSSEVFVPIKMFGTGSTGNGGSRVAVAAAADDDDGGGGDGWISAAVGKEASDRDDDSSAAMRCL